MANVAEEVSQWFFEEYFQTYVGSLNGSLAVGPEFLLDYWNVPVRLSAPGFAAWLRADEAVVGFHRDFDRVQAQSQGFADTAVLDSAVVGYHADAAGVELVFSRRRADGSEIGRFAAHYEVGRDARGWRIFSVQTAPTAAESLAEAWGQ
ncbi:MAG: DUF6841 family protein [Segniliparus sp.]|uniref:DUF6841 family protein n=1 Tax=Segniliparus sp. TaxID=2804064 RepID=UPI003F312F69